MSLNASQHILVTSKTGETVVDMKSIVLNISLIFNVLTVVLGISGNTVVIWVAAFKLKPQVTNVWLVNLATADLIFCCMRLLSIIKKLFFNIWPFGLFLCKFDGFFKYTNMFCSMFLLAVISLDRVLCVWRPLFTRRRRTLCAARVVAVCVWFAAILFSAPYFIFRNIVPKSENHTKCSLDDKNQSSSARMGIYISRFLCGFLVPFLVILTCYTLAGLGIRRTRLSGKSRPVRKLATLVIAFFLCWAPYHCLLLVKLVTKNQLAENLQPLVSAIAYFNSCVNPVLYFCMGYEVRGRIKQTLAGVFAKALGDDIDGRMTQSTDRSLDDSLALKPSTTLGQSQTSVDMSRV